MFNFIDDFFQNIKDKNNFRKNQKEVMAKIEVRRKLNTLKVNYTKMDQKQKDLIVSARKSLAEGDTANYNSAKMAIKMFYEQQRVYKTMITQFDIFMNIAEFTKSSNDFSNGISKMAKEIEKAAPVLNLQKATLASTKALTKNASMYEALKAFMEVTETNFEQVVSDINPQENITDDFIDKYIKEGITSSDNSIDEIDSKISDAEKKIYEKV
jgi:2-succinyl-5-enolpyruvyl-6-hydroxy-3-cyclohexene-1-carboxylate synthase